jgi:hypothetical protein
MPATKVCTSSSCSCEAGHARHGAGGGRFGQLATAVSLIAIFPLARALTPLLLRDALPLCPFRCATGKPCPLCGLTRAFAMASHGRWRDALKFNLLWPLFAGVIVLFSVLLVSDACTRRHSARRFGQALSRRWIWILSGLIVFGIWRIARE